MIVQTAEPFVLCSMIIPFFSEIYTMLWKLSSRCYRYGGGQASFELSEKRAAFLGLKLIHTEQTVIVSILNICVTFGQYMCNI